MSKFTKIDRTEAANDKPVRITLADAQFSGGSRISIRNVESQSAELDGFGPIPSGDVRVVVSNGKRWKRSYWREWLWRFANRFTKWHRGL